MGRWLGIDPGLSGALAVITQLDPLKQDFDISLIPFPTIENEPNFQELKKIFASLQDCKAVLEKVSAMPGQGVSSMFKFGRVYGAMQTCLHMFQIEHLEATPQKWQKEMHEGISRELDPKKRSLIAVQRLFPQVNLLATSRSRVPHDGFVDALLIAEYARRRFV